jgi:hypothetical protein
LEIIKTAKGFLGSKITSLGTVGLDLRQFETKNYVEQKQWFDTSNKERIIIIYNAKMRQCIGGRKEQRILRFCARGTTDVPTRRIAETSVPQSGGGLSGLNKGTGDRPVANTVTVGVPPLHLLADWEKEVCVGAVLDEVKKMSNNAINTCNRRRLEVPGEYREQHKWANDRENELNKRANEGTLTREGYIEMIGKLVEVYKEKIGELGDDDVKKVKFSMFLELAETQLKEFLESDEDEDGEDSG